MRMFSKLKVSDKSQKIVRVKQGLRPIPKQHPTPILKNPDYKRPVAKSRYKVWQIRKDRHEEAQSNTVAKAVASMDRQREEFPMHSDRDSVTNAAAFSRMGASGQMSSVIGLFKSTITDSNRYYFYTRDDLIHEAIDEFAGAMNNKGYKIKLVEPKESNLKFVKVLDQLFRKINLNQFTEMGTKLGFIYGVGWVGVNYEEDGTDLKTEPKKATDISFLSIIDNSSIEVDEVDDDRASKTYGAPLTYKISYDNAIGLSSKAEVIHASRVLRVVPLPFDDSIKGMSLIDPIIDKALVKKRMDFNIGDIYWRMAEPMVELITPNDKGAYDRAVEDFGENGFNSQRIWIHKRESNDPKQSLWELNLIGSQGKVLPPKEFYDVTVKPMLAGTGVPEDIVMGSTGSVQGNESNIERFYSKVRAKQNNVLTPLIRDLIDRMDRFGILRALGWKKQVPEYYIEWNPVYELTAKEETQKRLMDAKTHEIYSDMGAMDVEEIRADMGRPKLTQKQLKDFEDKKSAKVEPAVGMPAAGEPPQKKEISSKIPFSTHQNSKVDELNTILIEGDNDKLDNYLVEQ